MPYAIALVGPELGSSLGAAANVPGQERGLAGSGKSTFLAALKTLPMKAARKRSLGVNHQG